MPNRPSPVRSILCVSSVALLGVSACSSSTSSGSSSETSQTTPTVSSQPSSMRSLRYCEVLLLDLTESGLRAEVYNTYPLNDCPDDVWTGLDGAAIATSESVPFALLNGPRFWLMDAVERLDDGTVVMKTFSGTAGTIDMNRYAVVALGSPDTIGRAYTPQSVDRKSRFTFRAGSTIFVLTDPSGARYVMQSWSQQRDPSLSERDLSSLGSRLQLPQGWTFSVETLDADLVIDSRGTPAQVFQDELMNTYSLVTN